MKSISKIDSEKLNALKPIFIFFKKATGWFIGSIFIFGGLISFESNGVASSIAIIILGLLLVPSFWNFIVIKKLKLKIGWIIRLIIYFFLILVFALSAKPTAIQNNQEAMIKESSENLYAPIDAEDEKKEQEIAPPMNETVASTSTPTLTSKSTNVIDAITNKNTDFLIDNSKTYNFGCKQEMMGNVPGDNVEECKTQESFTAYTIGLIESGGAVVSKEQYRKFLEEFIKNDSFEFIKKYSKGDLLYLLEDGENLGFINFEKDKFLLVKIDRGGKIEIVYQDKKDLFEDYIY